MVELVRPNSLINVPRLNPQGLGFPGAGVDNLLLEGGSNFLLEDGACVLLLE